MITREQMMGMDSLRFAKYVCKNPHLIRALLDMAARSVDSEDMIQNVVDTVVACVAVMGLDPMWEDFVEEHHPDKMAYARYEAAKARSLTWRLD